MNKRSKRLIFAALITIFGGHYLWLLSQPAPVAAPAKQARKILYYRDPMGKDRTSPVPTQDEMGMDFIPVYSDSEAPASNAAQVDGRAAFSIPQDTQQMIGVTKTTIHSEKLSNDIRASGKVAYDPELYRAIEEYRIALKASSLSNGLGNNHGQDSLIDAARTKFRLLGFSDAQLKKLASGEIDAKEFLLPKDKAWIYAEVFEYELPMIQVGQPATVTIPTLPNEKFEGAVSSVGAIVEQSSRTVKIKIEINDPKKLLKPDMFANVFIHAEIGQGLVIPDSAVIHTGDQNLVYVVDENGRFEPRQVLLGESSSEKHLVKEGLKEGDTVVTSANFLIDSEARIRGVTKPAETSERAK